MKQLLFVLLLPCTMAAQSLPDSITRKIDEIFENYTTATPGCAVAVLQNGAVVFQKGYGMANLEYAVPITPQTIFHIASESKQYVAFCILLLEKEGRLSIDDDIRKYLDDVPGFGHTITIRHLIWHTSGLRDQWQLLACSGTQIDDVITQDHIVKLVSKQKTLNFKPGDEWLYCNTGYTLMAEIVKKVSGLSLREYAQKNIFGPLEMSNTHFHDDVAELVPGRAYSYYPGGQGKPFQHALLNYATVGATSLFTTVLDEAKWLNNYETGAVGGKALIEKMYQTGVLNDGRKLDYAFGINMGKYKGWRQIGHGGGDAGYRTFACRFPEKGLGIVVFSNQSNADPGGLTNRVADVFISSREETPPADVFVTDSTLLKKLAGAWYTDRGDRLNLFWEKGKLMRRNPNGMGVANEWKLATGPDNRYKLPGGNKLVLDEKDKTCDTLTALNVETPNTILRFRRQPPVPQTVSAEFAGKYYSAETDAIYYITFKDGQLTLDHRRYSSAPLTNMAPDQFTSPKWWMRNIVFLRNKQKKIIGFEVNDGRIMHLRFDKIQ